MRVGVAEAPIPVEFGVRLSSYSPLRRRPASGVLDPLHARAIFFEDGERRAAIVSCDVTHVGWPVSSAVALEAQRRWGLEPDAIMIAATHTHSSPSARFVRQGELDPAFIRVFVETLLSTLGRAIGGAADAQVFLGESRLEGWAFNRVQPDGPIDPRVRFLVAVGDGTEAWLLHHACHPVYVPVESELVSADYPGAAVQAFEAGGHFAAFLQGAAGDLNPKRHGQGFEWAVLHGQAIADAVMGSSRTPLSSEKIRFAAVDVELPLDLADARREAEAYLYHHRLRKNHEVLAMGSYLREWACESLAILAASPPSTLTTRLQGILLGNLLLLGAPGEPVSSLGASIEALSPVAAWTVGLANDNVGYLVRPIEYELETYAAVMAPKILGHFPFAPGVDQVVLEGFRNLVDRLCGETHD